MSESEIDCGESDIEDGLAGTSSQSHRTDGRQYTYTITDMSADHPPSHHHLGHYVHHPSINQNYNYVNKAKSHYCTYDGCEKAFATVAHMKRHLKTREFRSSRETSFAFRIGILTMFTC